MGVPTDSTVLLSVSPNVLAQSVREVQEKEGSAPMNQVFPDFSSFACYQF